ncbi:hypothetical protein TcBrA4_0024350 [Trypanosoma cruzi]|nr:hypothetical protein TcBrA4_0024350 [Trypanosoma cruzi]
MPLPGGELGTVCGHAQWQDTPLGRIMQGCQKLRGEAHRELRCPGSRVAARQIQTHAPARRTPLQPPIGLTPVQGVPGVPWLEYAQPAAARSVPGNNAVLSMWWRTRRSPSKTASPGSEIVFAAFQCIDDPMVSKRGCATHVLHIPETREAFVLCGCAETNDPPQRCWTGGQVDRSILR